MSLMNGAWKRQARKLIRAVLLKDYPGALCRCPWQAGKSGKFVCNDCGRANR